MEVYSPKKTVIPSFSRNEIRQEVEKSNDAAVRFYNIKPVRSRRETFSEWLNRRFYEPLKEFFENDISE